jgi:hypothetical protein
VCWCFLFDPLCSGKTSRMNFWQALSRGAAGTTALNAVTYLDMAVRSRPMSSTPEDVVEKIADKSGVGIPGNDQARQNRLAGLDPLSGIATGVDVGACADWPGPLACGRTPW